MGNIPHSCAHSSEVKPPSSRASCSSRGAVLDAALCTKADGKLGLLPSCGHSSWHGLNLLPSSQDQPGAALCSLFQELPASPRSFPAQPKSHSGILLRAQAKTSNGFGGRREIPRQGAALAHPTVPQSLNSPCPQHPQDLCSSNLSPN